MAEFALGLTKSAVEGTLSRVKLAIEEDAKLKIRVQNDLLFITGEFQMMRSFLNAANAERTRNDVVQTWVKQVRDLAFDVEDCVEFVVHLDKGSKWTNWFWRMLPSCVAPPLPLDEAVMELKQLKARVEDVSQRNTRYNLISDTGSSSKHPISVSSLSLMPELMPTSTEVRATSDDFDNLCKVWESTGKLRGTGDLRKLINNEGDNLEVISLWQSPGAGHLGVTHVIREAYNDPEINRMFKSKAWIKLMYPFNPDDFLKTLLTQVYASSCQQANIGVVDFRNKMKTAVATEDELMQQLCAQRYLVVVEELSTVVEWDAIKMYLPDSKNGSRIVVATQQLGLALSCTGDPYQVLFLRQLSDGQSLCAFFNKVYGRRSDMSEFIWQLRRPGVVSVWNDDPSSKSTLIDKVYTCITHKSKELNGVAFKRHAWVDAPYGLNIIGFSRHLLLSFHSDDFQAKQITAVSKMGNQEIIERCRRFLRDDYCLIVIAGPMRQSDWEHMKTQLLSEVVKACILVFTEDYFVARDCVDEECRAFSLKDLEADDILRHSLKDYEYYRFAGRDDSSTGRLFFKRSVEGSGRKRSVSLVAKKIEIATDWTNKFQHMGRQDKVFHDLQEYLAYPGVTSLWGGPGAGSSSLARGFYNNQLLIERENGMPRRQYQREYPDFGFIMYSWIEVPHPFDLADLCWRMILDFYSDAEKEKTAEALMSGQDPVEMCRMILHQYKCLVVVHGLQSTRDWDLMRDVLLSSGPISGCILVITDEESVARYCVCEDQPAHFLEARKYRRALNVTKERIKGVGASDEYGELDHRRCLFSSRMEEARDWFKKFELIVHHDESKHLLEHLRRGDSGVLSVWGIAGVDKSDIVRNIYYPYMIGVCGQSIQSQYRGNLRPFTKYSWVDVPHPFNLTNLSRRLLMDFHSDDLSAKETAAIGMMQGQDPIQECRKFMHQDKCFVVVRGLRSKDDWDLIKVAFLTEHVKGCIIVITNEGSVATHCAHREDGVINIKGLDAIATNHLFRKTIQDEELCDSDEVMKFSNLILAKCGGLPKVITAMGKYCKDKPKYNNIGDSFMTWLETNPSFHGLRDLLCWMQSYFDACSDSLKPCIFYLSVFHANQKIRQKRLLRRWIAEGYSRDTSGRSAEENGDMLFSELVGLSIIHQSDAMFEVNGFFLEYIISRSMEDNLVFALEGRCSINMQHAGKHLTISSSWDRDEIVFRSMDLSRLRSLTVFGEWRSFFISDDVNMRLLRVLDLEDTSDLKDGDIKQIGKLLPRLKFLSLRGCKGITSLPDSLGDMRQLQTLDIKKTNIVTLPLAIIKLQKLQCIHAGTAHEPSTSIDDRCGNGTKTSQPAAEATTSVAEAEATTSVVEAEAKTPWHSCPRALVPSRLSKLRKRGLVEVTDHNGVKLVAAAAKRIGTLTALQTLGVVNVGSASGGNTILIELKKLTQLRKLRLSGINLKNWDGFCSVISGQGYLESLSVRLNEDPTSNVVLANFNDIAEPPKTLKSLKVYGKNTHISAVWIKQLYNLTKVDLELTISTQEDIDTIVGLPWRGVFRRACVRPVEDGELQFGSFRERDYGDLSSFHLHVIKIDCRYRLRIVFESSELASVEVVVVHCSTVGSSWDLSGLEDLRRLEEVWLTGSYSEELKQRLQQKVAEHENKPVLKLEAQPCSRSVSYYCCV